MRIVLYIFASVLVFGFLILSHEAGHFFMAKLFKVKINEFSIGMGPAIFKKQGKSTLYSIRVLPIGGYVQMDGEDGDGESEDSFNKKAYWKRFLILVTGAIMNIVLGFILICIIMSQRDLLHTTVVGKFDKASVSDTCGLKVDDKIVKINNYKVDSYLDITYAIGTVGVNPVDITVIRNGSEVVLNNVSFPTITDENLGEVYTLDFRVYGVKRSFLNSIQHSFEWTVSITKSIYSFLGTIFTGQAKMSQVSGPVSTTVAIGESIQYGLDSLLLIVALISINLGIVNLLPFPALDGGRVLLLGIEAIRRKPLNPKIEVGINAVGMILLFCLMIVVAIKDIVNLF